MIDNLRVGQVTKLFDIREAGKAGGFIGFGEGRNIENTKFYNRDMRV